MINPIRRLSQRHRISLIIWGLNLSLCLILLVFVLR